MSVGVRTSLIAFAALLASCGYAGETGDDYKNSLAAKSVWSALQQAEWKLRNAPKVPYVYNADPASDMDTIAFPAKNGSGYVAFTAKASEGRVLSIPDDRTIVLDDQTLSELRRKRLISDAVAAEVLRRSG